MARIKFHDRGDYVVGAIELETGAPGTMRIAACGEDKADALRRAAAIAERICEDPVMSALMSERCHRDVVMVKHLAIAAKRGPDELRAAMAMMPGGAKRRLAAVLAQDQHENGEVGFIPLVLMAASLAQKYGPVAAQAYKAYAAKKKAAKAAHAQGDMSAANELARQALEAKAVVVEHTSEPANVGGILTVLNPFGKYAPHNLLKRALKKKKRKVGPMRMRRVSEEEQPEEEQPEEEQPEEESAGDIGDDVGVDTEGAE